jgi:hypothetical protein
MRDSIVKRGHVWNVKIELDPRYGTASQEVTLRLPHYARGGAGPR